MEAGGADGDPPLGEVRALLVEDLNAMVVAIVDEDAFRLEIDRHPMDVVHVPRTRLLPGLAGLPEIELELPAGIELRDARAVIPIRHVEAPIGQPRHECRTVEVS